MDVLRLNDLIPPDAIRIQVHVSGNYDMRVIQSTAAGAVVGVVQLNHLGPVNQPGQVTDYGPLNPAVADIRAFGAPPGRPDDFSVTTSAASNLALRPGETPLSGFLSWDADFLIPYDAELGGYQLNLYAAATTSSYGTASAFADFGHTFKLTAVTQADGSPLAGPVAFDSGFSLNSDVTAAPAPAGLLLALTGAGCLGGVGWLRRRRPAATTG
jgi:hypothetical protein